VVLFGSPTRAVPIQRFLASFGRRGRRKRFTAFHREDEAKLPGPPEDPQLGTMHVSVWYNSFVSPNRSLHHISFSHLW